ncbi:MAG: hypothetical protein HYX69_20935 [Planctomycetia bacterium]|nr:hypothetical protein [Planctomycetia bacterium]
MRLTLRTMLAYLDEMLEPADAQELARKIEDSEFATGLMHRTRDVTRRLKLAAPRLDGRGLALDANSVAEYLDNTLPAEQFPEFEKICLESDVHLAEVASAHQILALVLGEPAEVDPKMRRRMYTLAERQPEAEAKDGYGVSPAEEPTVVAPVAAAVPRRRRPEVPEWLRDQPKQRNYWLPAVAAALVVGIGIGAYALFLRLEKTPGPAVAQVDEAAKAAAAKSVTPDTASPPPVAENSAAARDAVSSEPSPDSVPAPPPSDTAHDVAPSRTDVPDDPFNTDVPGALPDDSSPAAVPAAADALPAPSADEAPLPAKTADEAALTDQALVPGRTATDADAAPAVQTAAIGRLMTATDILLRAEGADRSWRRLSIRDPLAAGDELIALPTYRPAIVFSTAGGVTAQLLGGAVIQLSAADRQGVPGLHVIEGQVVILTAGKPGTQLNLQIGDRACVLTLSGVDAAVAVDVRRSLPDGADPRTEAATTTADLYVHGGEVEYVDQAGGARETVKAPGYKALLPAPGRSEPLDGSEVTFPTWITGNTLSQVEKWAADAVEKDLAAGEPVRLRLHELADNRKVEVRSLAAQCLTLLGDFEAFLPALNDVNQRANWNTQIDAARRALARGPEMAEQLKKTFEVQRDSKKAKDLYDMMCGYSRQQFLGDTAARLVADLDSDELDFRVLAFWNLQKISVGTLGYRPEYTGTKRQQSIRAWKQKLDAGQLVPKS